MQKNVKAFLGSLTFLHRKFSSIIRALDLNKLSPDVCFVTVLSDDLQPNMIKVHFHVTPRKLRDLIIQKLNFSLRKLEAEYMITKKL